MITLPSDYSFEELVARWDDFTSPARFAGSDESLDLVYKSRRRGDKVTLVRRSDSMREPYAAVFRGKIVKTAQGSEIRGIFTKSFADYAVTAAIIALAVIIRIYAQDRADSLETANVLLAAAIIIGLLLLFNLRSAKRKYLDFICKITGKEVDLFKSRRESKGE